jgi:acyl carrier protein
VFVRRQNEERSAAPASCFATTVHFHTAMSDIAREVIAQIAAVLGAPVERITRDTLLARDLGADSLASVALVLAIEDRFSIDLPDEEVEQLQTVQQLVEYVELAVAMANPAGRPQEYSYGTGNRYYRP